MTDSALMRSQQPTFQKGHDPMNPRQQMFLSIRLASLNTSVMGVASQTLVRRQTIGSDCAPAFNHLSDEPMECSLTQIQHAPQTNPPNPSASDLDGHHNQRLLRYFPTCYSLFLGTPVRLVDFHDSPKAISARPYHCPPQFMQQGPRRLVAAATLRMVGL